MIVLSSGMTQRTPQRSYSPQAIETWFLRLNQDWEEWFTKDELYWGREYYRTGDVRSTELLEGSAIIHFKQGREPVYVIVDWNGKVPDFRESHPGLAPGRGLGVAGMYELEELVADELPPCEAAGEQVNGGISGDREAMPDEAGVKEAETPTERTGRRLRVRLQARTDGLWLESGWDAGGKGTDWSSFSLRELTKWEREQLIGYTARAHRSGFRPGDREGCYRLQEPLSIQRFLQKDLGHWKGRYGLEEDPGVKAWKQGLKRLFPVIDIEADGGKGRFRLDFRTAGGRVTDTIRAEVFRHPGHAHFVPGKGIFQADPSTLGSLQEWKTLLPATGEGLLPRYLLFTLAGDPHVEINLSEELARWRAELEAAADTAGELDLLECLRSYQREGVAWLAKLEAAGCHGLLADEMGLGKTLQILSFLKARDVLGKRAAIVVCPASVVPVWQAEIKQFFPGTPVKVLSRHDPFKSDQAALWIASYTQLRRNKSLLETIEFDVAILDEAQSIKNPDAKVTHACMAIQSRQRIALTGTPMENRPLDLWTIFRFLMPGFLGSRRQFEDGVKEDGDFLKRLRTQIAPFLLRRTKRAVASDLPPKVEFDWTCSLTPVQRRLYTELVSGAAREFSGDIGKALREKRMHLFSLLTRLRQVCCDPAILPGRSDHWTHSGKLTSLNGRLEEAFESGSKVVVFSQFVQFLRRARAAVKSEFPEVAQFELTGSTLDRERPVKAFAETEGAAVFFISLRAGGTGLNLQMTDYLFLMDPWWNPAVEAQAIDRAHRIGKKKRVIVYRMVTEGTIEEKIKRLKAEKGRIFTDLLTDMDAPADILGHFVNLEDLIALEEPVSPRS